MMCFNETDFAAQAVMLAVFGIAIISISDGFTFGRKEKDEPEDVDSARRRKRFNDLDLKLGQMQWLYSKQLPEDKLVLTSFRTLKAAVIGTRGFCACPEYGPDWFEKDWEVTVAFWEKQAISIEACLLCMKQYDEQKNKIS